MQNQKIFQMNPTAWLDPIGARLLDCSIGPSRATARLDPVLRFLNCSIARLDSLNQGYFWLLRATSLKKKILKKKRGYFAKVRFHKGYWPKFPYYIEKQYEYKILIYMWLIKSIIHIFLAVLRRSKAPRYWLIYDQDFYHQTKIISVIMYPTREEVWFKD